MRVLSVNGVKDIIRLYSLKTTSNITNPKIGLIANDMYNIIGQSMK